jgi:hypothetical protein
MTASPEAMAVSGAIIAVIAYLVRLLSLSCADPGAERNGIRSPTKTKKIGGRRVNSISFLPPLSGYGARLTRDT